MAVRFMTCQEITEALTGYLDGALPPGDRLALERHVAICPPCRGNLSQARALLAAAGRLRAPDADAPGHEAILAAFRALGGGG